MTTTATPPPAAAPAEGPRRDPVVDALRDIRSRYAALADVGVWALDDKKIDARLEQALAARAAADELVARVVCEADAAGVAGRAGCSSTRAWLASRHKVSLRDAKQTLARSRAMSPRTEATRLAWAHGKIGGDQAEVIGTAVNQMGPDLPADRVEAGERDLLRHAAVLPVRDLQRVANRLVEVVDPDSADAVLGERLEAQEKWAAEQAVFRLTKGVDGVARFGGKIPNLHADMLLANLEALASPRRDHLHDDSDGENDAAADPQATDPDTGKLIPYGQRLGRALMEWIERLPSDGSPPSNGVNATLVVTIDEQRLRDGLGAACLNTGEDLSVGEARRLACGAGILPMVLGGDSVPLDLGRSRRLFTPHQKIALGKRDGGCVFPGCDRPPGWAEAHHARLAWADGGLTDVKDGCLLCWFHHRLVHKGEWDVRFAPDGLPEIVPPERVDRQRRPTRHRRLKPRAG